MSNQKYDAPGSPPPPPAYGNVQSPQPAHTSPSNYDASPYQNNAVAYQGDNGYPPNVGQSPGPGGYYQQGNMNYGQQGGYPQQGYGGPPQGGYYGQGQQGYPQQGYYPPQGQYRDSRGPGAATGFLGACAGCLALCCCLDFLF